MIQNTYGGRPAVYKRGQVTRTPEYIKGRAVALENLEPDALLVYGGYPLDKSTVRKPMQTLAILTGSANLATSHSTVGTVTIQPLNGEAVVHNLDPVVYADSHADTLAALAAEIQALPGVRLAVPDAAARTITVYADGDYHITLSGFTTTLGSGQPTWSYTHGSADVKAGFVTNRDTEPNDDGFCYEKGDTVKVMVRGGVAALVENAVTGSSQLFARFKAGAGANEHRGVICNDAGSPAVAMSVGDGVAVEVGAGAGEIAEFALNLTGA